MADPLSLYNGPGNRGAAFILDDGWQTPLGLLQQQQQQKRADAASAAAAKAAKEKETTDQLRKLYDQDFGSFWDRDHEYVTGALTDLRDTASNYLQMGVNWSDPLRNPREHAEIQKGIQEARRRHNMSDQQYKQYKTALELANKDEDGIYDKQRITQALESYAGLTPEERAKQVLSLDKYYNLANVASTLFKGFDPQKETTYKVNGKGGVEHRSIKTYSEEQLKQMAGLIREDSKFKASIKSDFADLSEQQQKEAGGLEGFMDSRARDLADKFQRRDVEKKYGVDGAYWNRLRLNRDLANDGKDDRKKLEAAERRVKYINAIAKGEWDNLQSLQNAKVAGGYITKVVPEMGKDDHYPKIKFTISKGSVTVGEDADKTKKHLTETVVIDTAKKGWEDQLNSLLNSEKGEKVAPELFNEVLKKGGYDMGTGFWNSPVQQQPKPTPQMYWQEAMQPGQQPAADDPFQDFDAPAADPNDPFADFE